MEETATSNDSSVEMSCEMSQFIRPDEFLIWQGPGGETIDSSNRYEITYMNGTANRAANGSSMPVSSRVSTLTISDPIPSDSGTYTCTVMGTSQAQTINLIVTGSNPITSGTTTGATTGESNERLT